MRARALLPLIAAVAGLAAGLTLMLVYNLACAHTSLYYSYACGN